MALAQLALKGLPFDREHHGVHRFGIAVVHIARQEHLRSLGHLFPSFPLVHVV